MIVSNIGLILLAFGICFGLQHKVSFLHKKHPFLDKMLKCTYCTGFHAGWIAWLFVCAIDQKFPSDSVLSNILMTLGFAFVSAISCYIMDILLRWVESHIEEYEVVEEEE